MCLCVYIIYIYIYIYKFTSLFMCIYIRINVCINTRLSMTILAWFNVQGCGQSGKGKVGLKHTRQITALTLAIRLPNPFYGKESFSCYLVVDLFRDA